MKIKSLLFSALVVTSSFAIVGCGEAQRTYECREICDNYAACVDSSLDESGCVDHCEAMGDLDPDFEQQATDCENCLDDKSCAESESACASTCDSVVAEST